MSTEKQEEMAIKGLGKTFTVASGNVEALRDINLTINKGEFISIVGASGCGKSTLLRIIMGLESIDSGSIYMDGAKIISIGEDTSMVFQESRLLPWFTIEQNVSFGVTRKDMFTDKQRKERVKELLELVGIEKFAKVYPHQLSGGMQQRASIARALISNPRVLLMDEPFGALDALTRINMQQEILKIWQRECTTMVLVTHDIDEAIYLGDKVVVMTSRPGTIKNIFDVDLSRPRDRDSPGFVEIHKKIYENFFTKDEPPFSYTI
ncbi:MAG: ABC transporter ATP-binding protein [Clostridium sp.]|uniref:ABC transporter ATP-binding protein n=1 Tax=Clostridium sp. TaxID=1506 RepID=UPI0039EC7F07